MGYVMRDYIEFEINGRQYWAKRNSSNAMFSWCNQFDEQGRDCATPLAAQQDAIAWESGRRERYEGSAEEAEDARNRYLNRRCDEARGA